MATVSERITIDPEQCGGRPCVRSMRIRVSDVLDLLANGLATEQVLAELPDLELEDIRACLSYASRQTSHPAPAAWSFWGGQKRIGPISRQLELSLSAPSSLAMKGESHAYDLDVLRYHRVAVFSGQQASSSPPHSREVPRR